MRLFILEISLSLNQTELLCSSQQTRMHAIINRAAIVRHRSF